MTHEQKHWTTLVALARRLGQEAARRGTLVGSEVVSRLPAEVTKSQLKVLWKHVEDAFLSN